MNPRPWEGAPEPSRAVCLWAPSRSSPLGPPDRRRRGHRRGRNGAVSRCPPAEGPIRPPRAFRAGRHRHGRGCGIEKRALRRRVRRRSAAPGRPGLDPRGPRTMAAGSRRDREGGDSLRSSGSRRDGLAAPNPGGSRKTHPLVHAGLWPPGGRYGRPARAVSLGRHDMLACERAGRKRQE